MRIVLRCSVLLLAALLLSCRSTADDAKIKRADQKIRELKLSYLADAVRLYRKLYFINPTKLSDLTGCPPRRPDCHPLAHGSQITHSGEEFLFSCSDSGSVCTLTSLGMDRKLGGSGRDADVSETVNLEEDLSTSARSIPDFRDGTMIGTRLFGIQPGSSWETWGFQNGDVITEINGKPIPNEAARSLGKAFLNGKTFSVKIIRDQSMRTFEIKLK